MLLLHVRLHDVSPGPPAASHCLLCCSLRMQRRTAPLRGVCGAPTCGQAWHTTKLALISCVLYVPIAVGMIAIAYSSMKRKERNLHGGIPVLVSGVAFMCARAHHAA